MQGAEFAFEFRGKLQRSGDGIGGFRRRNNAFGLGEQRSGLQRFDLPERTRLEQIAGIERAQEGRRAMIAEAARVDRRREIRAAERVHARDRRGAGKIIDVIEIGAPRHFRAGQRLGRHQLHGFARASGPPAGTACRPRRSCCRPPCRPRHNPGSRRARPFGLRPRFRSPSDAAKRRSRRFPPRTAPCPSSRAQARSLRRWPPPASRCGPGRASAPRVRRASNGSGSHGSRRRTARRWCGAAAFADS